MTALNALIPLVALLVLLALGLTPAAIIASAVCAIVVDALNGAK